MNRPIPAVAFLKFRTILKKIHVGVTGSKHDQGTDICANYKQPLIDSMHY
jgi:hypothetical protein